MTQIAELSSAAAAHIVQRMGESGQPPDRRALAVNVGTESILATLRDEYLVPIREAGRNSSFKLVQAPYGGGKSQFLHCLRELAEQEGFCTALVGVSPQECPFDDPVQIYRAVARAIELPPEDEDFAPEPGITNLLRTLALQRVDRYGKDAFLEWTRSELAHRQAESTSLLRAVVAFLQATVEGRSESQEILGDYLRGEISSASELTPFRIRELPNQENGFRFLRSLAQIIRHLELPGLALLFDELDRTMSLAKRRKRAIGDNLRQMIDHCGQAVLPGVLLVYAVPPEFMNQVVPEYPALEQRLKNVGHFGPVSPLAPVIDLDHLPLPTLDLFQRIGAKLLDLYQHGYSVDLGQAMQTVNLALLARTMTDDLLESGSRRTFVKAAVGLLSQQHREGAQRLSDTEVARWMRRAQAQDQEAAPLDGEREI